MENVHPVESCNAISAELKWLCLCVYVLFK